MIESRFAGIIMQVVGAIKEAFGYLTDVPSARAEGAAQRTAGRAIVARVALAGATAEVAVPVVNTDVAVP